MEAGLSGHNGLPVTKRVAVAAPIDEGNVPAHHLRTVAKHALEMVTKFRIAIRKDAQVLTKIKSKSMNRLNYCRIYLPITTSKTNDQFKKI